MAREDVAALQQTKRCWRDLEQHLEVTVELKMTTAAHRKIQHKKKVRNKQVDRLGTIFGCMISLEEISPRNNSLHQRKKIHLLKSSSC